MDITKFTRDYIVRSYECDRNNRMRIITLMNIFQDMAYADVTRLGFGVRFCLKNKVTWVGSNYAIEIDRLPKMDENIRIQTWASAEKKVSAIRDFEVFGEDGKSIIRASSQWVMIDFVKHRPVALKERLPEYNLIENRALETDFPKIKDLEHVDYQAKFRVRYDDIDLNRHVNNAVYALWACESVDSDFRLKHTPHYIEIAFKKEGYLGEKIMVNTQFDGKTTTHSINTYDGDNNRELAKATVVWQER